MANDALRGEVEGGAVPDAPLSKRYAALKALRPVGVLADSEEELSDRPFHPSTVHPFAPCCYSCFLF